MAERGGFEPPIAFQLCPLSRRVHSTTLPPLQCGVTLRGYRIPPESVETIRPSELNIPRQSRGDYDVSRSKRLYGVANAAPVVFAT
jgi:hypothetical protein